MHHLKIMDLCCYCYSMITRLNCFFKKKRQGSDDYFARTKPLMPQIGEGLRYSLYSVFRTELRRYEFINVYCNGQYREIPVTLQVFVD